MQPRNPISTPGGQAEFTAALFDPDAPLPTGLAASGGAAPVKRFAVYRNNVIASLTDALGKAYPVIKGLVGETFFTAMAGHFVREHPPVSPVMLTYGDGFAGWLENFEPVSHLSYLSDVARIERARLESYHAADAEPLSQAVAQVAFAGRAPEEVTAARFTPHPSLRLLDLSTPALSIWKAAQSGDKLNIPSGRERVIIVRPVEQVTLRAAPPDAFTFLSALCADQSIAEATAAARPDSGDFDLASALSGAFASGFFTAVRL